MFFISYRSLLQKIGFVFSTKEEFLKIVQEFNLAYEKQMEQCHLYHNKNRALQYFDERGYVQYTVSGLNQRDLMKMVKGKNQMLFLKNYWIERDGCC